MSYRLQLKCNYLNFLCSFQWCNQNLAVTLFDVVYPTPKIGLRPVICRNLPKKKKLFYLSINHKSVYTVVFLSEKLKDWQKNIWIWLKNVETMIFQTFVSLSFPVRLGTPTILPQILITWHGLIFHAFLMSFWHFVPSCKLKRSVLDFFP